MTTRAELFRALGSLCEPPTPAAHSLEAALALPGPPTDQEHTDVFLFQLYPYASVYLGAEGMLGGEAGDRVAGFWRALGVTPPAEPDHLAALLALYAKLIEWELEESDDARRALRREARKALLWEHLLSWVPVFADKVCRMTSPFYAGWAYLLFDALIDEARSLGGQETLSLHLRVAPELPRPSENPSSFLSALLAPVRSGMVITRADLARAAHDLDLGLRVGERRFVLESFFAQDADATLEWLTREAYLAAEHHASFASDLEVISLFWRGRAEAAAALLSAGLSSAEGVMQIHVCAPPRSTEQPQV
ncbi:MAG: molecular chaperone TorD family protein [Actinomycetota bacterium]|nr:molecular chaperone TorD family protein [Actinomycetota bacterium]